jgi:glycerol-3-phosphate acyltransferase PlsY
MLVPFVIAAAAGYLLGALPFGYLVARAKGVNIFEAGSKSSGATNVRRVLGNGPGALVLLLDALKGAAAVGLAWLVVRFGSDAASTADGIERLAVAGLVAAIVGHSFSCFTGFRGGKSVATGAGGMLVLFPLGGLIALAIFVLTLAVLRFVSLSSMLGAASLPITAVVLGRSTLLVGVTAAVALFVILRHRSNISRLLAGTEPRVGRKPAAAPTS